MDSDICMEIDGRLSITQAQTPTGTTFQFMNIYQFTAANPTGQTDMWTTKENWINKQKNTRIIMQGDLNCAHPGCRWDYAQPLNKDIGTADNKLEHFLNNMSGHSYTQQEHTWKGKECRAALDHVLTWNELSPPTPDLKTKNATTDHCQKTTAKYGPNCSTWTSQNGQKRPGPPNPTSPNVSTPSSLNDM